MARIRSVHPDICMSTTMAALSAGLERTFVRLWTHCDDEGRCEDRPRIIKAGIYPEHDDMTWQRIDAELDELRDAGLIVRYEGDDGKGYIAVASWDEYQHPQRPRPSKCPAPPASADRPQDVSVSSNGHDPDASLQSQEPSASARGHVADDALTGGGGGEGDTYVEPNGDAPVLALVPDPVSPPATVPDQIRTVFAEWQEVTGHKRAVLDDKRKERIRKALKLFPLDDVLDSVRGWRHSTFHRGHNSRDTTYDGLHLILRDAEQIEKFRDLERDPSRRPGAKRTAADGQAQAVGLESPW